MRGKITKRTVDALQCPGGRDREFLWDTEISGFGVAAFPSGEKVYVAQYRQDGRSRRLNIGKHGRLTPDEARSLAKQKLGAVEGGADPIAERKASREVRTFREVAEEFLARHVEAKRKAHTAEEYGRLLRLHVLPTIGWIRVVDVDRRAVARMHSAMAPTPAIANKALAVISSIWGWAARRDEVSATANPARGIERYPEDRRERFLTTDEFRRLGDALRVAETAGLPWRDKGKPIAKHEPKRPENRREVLDPYAVAAIRLLILTGARLREVLNLKWSDLDAERGMAFLPDSKTGAKPLYLSAAALAVLASIPRVEGNVHVIAGQGGAPRMDLKRPWASVSAAAGLSGVRLHDLRHSFASGSNLTLDARA